MYKKSKYKGIHANQLYTILFETYKDLNINVFKDKFFMSVLNTEHFHFKTLPELTPIFFSQMGVLFNIQPYRFDGMINNNLLHFFSYTHKDNMVFLLTNSGLLKYIMIMQTKIDERIVLNSYFAKHINIFHKYKNYTTDYDSTLDAYKLLTAKPSNELKTEDILLIFHN